MMTELSSLLSTLQDLGSKELSILLSESSPTVLIRPVDGISKEYLFHLEGTEVHSLLSALAPMGKDFRTVTVISGTKEVTYLPDGLYDASKDAQYLDAVFGPSRLTSASAVHIPALGLHYIFRVDESLATHIETCFPQAQVRHLCESLMLETWASVRHADALIFRIHQQGSDLFIMTFKEKHLNLSSHHHIGDPTDVVYQCLNTINAYEIDYDQAQIVCSGTLQEGTESIDLLRSYCPLTVVREARFTNLKAPQEFILASHTHCES